MNGTLDARREEALPPGLDRLDGACASRGWALAVRGPAAFSWSPTTGWRPLPTAAAGLDIVGATEGGIVVLSRPAPGALELGLWPWGAGDWAFWERAEGRAFGALDDRLLLDVSTASRLPRRIVIHSTATGRLVPVLEAEDAGPGSPDPLRAAETRGGCIHVLSVPCPPHRRPGDAIVKQAYELAQGHPRGSGRRHLAVRHCVVGPGGAGIEVLDTETGLRQPGRFPLSTPALRHLWGAMLDADRPLVDNLAAFLERLPPVPPASLFDLVVVGRDPVAAVASCGVVRALEEPSADPQWRAYVRRDLGVTSWRLWVDPAAHLEAAVDEYLALGDTPSGAVAAGRHELLQGLTEVARYRLPDLAFERVARGANVSATGADLFRHFGERAGGLILAALDHPDPRVREMAWLAAAQPPLGAEPPTGPQAEGFVQALEAGVGAAEAEVRAAAFVAARALRAPRLARLVELGVRDPERRVRQRAAQAAAAVVVPADAPHEAIRRVALDDPDPEVRAACAPALARFTSDDNVDTLVAMLGGVGTASRRAAADALGQAVRRVDDVARLIGIVDLSLLLLMTGRQTIRRGRSPSRFLEGVLPLARSTLRSVVRTGDRKMKPERVSAALAVERLLEGVFPEAGRIHGSSRTAFEPSPPDPVPLLSEEEREQVRGGPTPALVREIGRRAGGALPEVGSAFTVCGLLAPAAETEVAPLPQPLADLHALASRPGLPGLVTAYALALHGDEAAGDEVARRTFGEDFTAHPLIALSWAIHVGEERARDYAAALAGAHALPAGLRREAAEAIRGFYDQAPTHTLPLRA